MRPATPSRTLAKAVELLHPADRARRQVRHPDRRRSLQRDRPRQHPGDNGHGHKRHLAEDTEDVTEDEPTEPNEPAPMFSECEKCGYHFTRPRRHPLGNTPARVPEAPGQERSPERARVPACPRGRCTRPGN